MWNNLKVFGRVILHNGTKLWIKMVRNRKHDSAVGDVQQFFENFNEFVHTIIAFMNAIETRKDATKFTLESNQGHNMPIRECFPLSNSQIRTIVETMTLIHPLSNQLVHDAF